MSKEESKTEKKTKVVLLFNKGNRTISIEGKSFKPNTSEEFSEESANKILSLFPQEVFKTNSVLFVDESGQALKQEQEAHETTKKQLIDLQEKYTNLKKEYDELVM